MDFSIWKKKKIPSQENTLILHHYFLWYINIYGKLSIRAFTDYIVKHYFSNACGVIHQLVYTEFYVTSDLMLIPTLFWCLPLVLCNNSWFVLIEMKGHINIWNGSLSSLERKPIPSPLKNSILQIWKRSNYNCLGKGFLIFAVLLK